MKRFLVISTALLAACGVTQEEHEAALAEARQSAAERDSLVAEVLVTAALINEIQVELADIEDSTITMAVPTEGALDLAADENRVALSKVRAAIRQLQESQEEMERTRERIAELSVSESRLLRQIARYEETITELRTAAELREAELTAVIEDQRTQIAVLQTEVGTVRSANEYLAGEIDALSDSVTSLALAENRVYYIAGTKRDLEDRGVVVNEGRKFLFFGSKTLQPARDLNPDDFTAIDKTRITEIILPEADQEYRILTRHNPAFLASPVSDDGKVRELLAIASPDEFWAPSRFLILVRQ